MKKFIVLICTLSLFYLASSINAKADDSKILLKCEGPVFDYLAVIDFENKLFDAVRFSDGIPEKLNYWIDEINDKKITAVAEEVTTYNDGSEVIWLITITIDRHLATIRDKHQKIKDTRKNLPESEIRLVNYKLKNCQKYTTTKVF